MSNSSLRSSRSTTTEDNSFAENYCNTKLDYKKCSFKWTIEDYSVHKTRDSTLKSSIFSAADDKFMWYLQHSFYSPLSRRGYRTESESYVSLKLCPNSSDDLMQFAPVSGKAKFSIVKDGNSKGRTKQKIFVINSIHCTNFHTDEPLFNEFIKKSELCGDWLPKDKLTIFCDITYVKNDGIVNISTSSHLNHCEIPGSSPCQDFEQLFYDEKFTDITIVLLEDGEQYRAHKGILAVRSSVFNAMFTHNMKEKTSHRIEISDISSEVFGEMIRYIYTGNVNNLEESAIDLLAPADKYDLKGLKIMCERAICKKLSVDNAVKILILADMHHADQLKSQTLRFIRSQTHGTNIMDTEIWNVLCTSHPHLMKDMLTAFIKQ